jgi:hypothetical protein
MHCYHSETASQTAGCAAIGGSPVSDLARTAPTLGKTRPTTSSNATAGNATDPVAPCSVIGEPYSDLKWGNAQ